MDRKYAYPNRVRNPLRVLLAAWRVSRDLANTAEAGILEIAFARSRLARRFARWDAVAADVARHPEVRAAMRERRRLGWIDLAELRLLGPGTLGRTFAEHCTAKGLNPNLIEPFPGDDDATWFLSHVYETHDLWHVLTGFGNDELGEFSIAGVYAAQTGAPFVAFLLAFAFLNTVFVKPQDVRLRLEALTAGWQIGQAARPLVGLDWRNLWPAPIGEVRRQLDLPSQPQPVGEGILAAA